MILHEPVIRAALRQAWQDSPPNTGSGFLQEPSPTDMRAVRDDPDLKGVHYVGEFVISQATIYLIDPTGQVSEVVSTLEYLAAP